jgi:hypothetical protein
LHGDPLIEDLSDDIKELFNSVRNYYLDTSDESKCNWMIHVDIAQFSNEQNLMAYQVKIFPNDYSNQYIPLYSVFQKSTLKRVIK